jgi:hypothetical protein
MRQGSDLVGCVEGSGAHAAYVGALDIHRAACAGAIVPQQNRTAARQRANTLHKAPPVELDAAVIVEGAAEVPRRVVLKPATEESERGGGRGGREKDEKD